ncbi:MAG: hypothetical protein AAGF60_15305 [Pseudomonadota bacterium]
MILWNITLVLIGFFLAFAVGPMALLRAVRLPVRAVYALLFGMAALLLLGLWVQGQMSARTDHAAVLLCLWGAWLAGCAALVLALRPRLDAVRWRWARMLGAAATTAPWFGFAAAQLNGG